MLTSFDLHLLGEGTHFDAFNKLGAHVIESEYDRVPERLVDGYVNLKRRNLL